MFHRIKTSAFSLLEVILAVAIFAIFASVLLVAISGEGFNIKNSQDRLSARYLTQEAQEGLRSIRDNEFNDLVDGTHGLDSITNGYWILSGSSDAFGKFTRDIVITHLATDRAQAVITISWTTDEGIAQTFTSTLRLTDLSDAFSFIVDTLLEFDEGFFNSTDSVSPGSAQLESLLTVWNAFVTLIGQDADGTGDGAELYIDNDFLYFASENTIGEEFTVYDISDVSFSSTVTELGSLEISDDVNDIAVDAAGAYAYLVTDADLAELVIVDLSDVSLVQFVDLTGDADANGIALYGNTAVVVRDDQVPDEEIYILDISNPEGSITETAALEYGNDVYDVEVDGDYAFVVSEAANKEIGVIRLTDNTEQNTINMSGSADANSIFIDDANDIAYIGRDGGSDPQFSAFDISSPESFGTGDILGSTTISGNIFDIYVVDGRAYLASSGNNDEYEVIDLATYTLESSLSIDGNNDGKAVWYQGTHIYGATDHDDNELVVLETTANIWSSPAIVDTDDPDNTHDMRSLAVDGSYLYAGRSHNGNCNSGTGSKCEFFIYDISTPTAIVRESSLEIGAHVNGIYINGDYAYLATTDNAGELTVVDISNKSAPSIVATYDTQSGSNAKAITGSGDYVHLVTRTDNGNCNTGSGNNCEYYILDISTPTSPTYEGALELNTNGNDVVLNGANHSFVSTGENSEEIMIIDVSTTSAPSKVASYNHPGSADGAGMFYNSNDATLHFVLGTNTGNGNYSILDASTPASLTRLGYLDYSSSHSAVVVIDSQNVAFLASDVPGKEFLTIDITDTSNPFELVSLGLSGQANDIATDGTYAYVANTDNSQEIQVIGSGSATTMYSRYGIYTSKKFDSTSASNAWLLLSWEESGTGTIQFQTRTASSLGGLDLATWVGSDGTHATYYTSSPATVQVHSGSTGTQYIQIAAYLSGDSSATPLLDKITITYNP